MHADPQSLLRKSRTCNGRSQRSFGVTSPDKWRSRLKAHADWERPGGFFFGNFGCGLTRARTLERHHPARHRTLVDTSRLATIVHDPAITAPRTNVVSGRLRSSDRHQPEHDKPVERICRLAQRRSWRDRHFRVKGSEISYTSSSLWLMDADSHAPILALQPAFRSSPPRTAVRGA